MTFATLSTPARVAVLVALAAPLASSPMAVHAQGAAQPAPAQPAAASPAPAAEGSSGGFPSFNSVFSKPQGVVVQPPPAAAPPAAGSLPAARGATPVPPVAVQAPRTAPAVSAPAAAAPAPAKTAAAKPPAPAKPKSPAVQAALRPTEAAVAKAAETRGVGIAVMVNDEPITGYEIEQRQRFMGMSANIGERASAAFKKMIQDPSVSDKLKAILAEVINANKGKTREQIIAIFEQRKKQFAQSLQQQAVQSARASVLPGLRKAALDELIDERLKLQEAKRLNVVASDEDVGRIVRSIAEKNKMTEAQFAQHLSGMGADIEAMRGRFRASLSWNEVIKRKFGREIAISERDVERMVSQGPAGDDQVELQLQRVVLPMPGKLVQKVIDQRVAEAESLRARFSDCKSMAALAGSIENARHEDLGTRKAGTVAEPTRSLLLAAKDGEMAPPAVGSSGVELYAVCGRQVIKADEEKRTAAMQELRQQEFELFAKRHLRILRDDATIATR